MCLGVDRNKRQTQFLLSLIGYFDDLQTKKFISFFYHKITFGIV